MIKEIGGYFEFELNCGNEYHKGAIKLNTGRNCLEYLLKCSMIQKIYLPAYTCDAVLSAVRRCRVKYAFYNINEEFDPLFNEVLKDGEAFLYTNYFGIKDKAIQRLACAYGQKLVVDNAQAFYSRPAKALGTFYSPRKFFGVPDGGYLYCNNGLDATFEKDISYKRIQHLVRRLDVSAEEGYKLFKRNDEFLSKQPIKIMSNLTQRILRNINYRNARQRRRNNFNFLHENLGSLNELHLQLGGTEVPMVYPFLHTKRDLHELLISNNIFIARYWYKTVSNELLNSYERALVTNLLPLPIDQRYNEKQMAVIVSMIRELI